MKILRLLHIIGLVQSFQQFLKFTTVLKIIIEIKLLIFLSYVKNNPLAFFEEFQRKRNSFQMTVINFP